MRHKQLTKIGVNRKLIEVALFAAILVLVRSVVLVTATPPSGVTSTVIAASNLNDSIQAEFMAEELDLDNVLEGGGRTAAKPVQKTKKKIKIKWSVDSTGIPIFAVSQRGKELLLERAKEVTDPILINTPKLPVQPEEKQPKPLV